MYGAELDNLPDLISAHQITVKKLFRRPPSTPTDRIMYQATLARP